jgi:hypothetical protein
MGDTSGHLFSTIDAYWCGVKHHAAGGAGMQVAARHVGLLRTVSRAVAELLPQSVAAAR